MSRLSPRRWRAVLTAAAVGLATLLLPGGTAHAAPVTVDVGVQFTDTSGNLVQAHGGGVIKVGSYYYWFGENRHPDNLFRAVSVYRSTDLKTWEFRNNVLTQNSHSELRISWVERPKVVYNASTGQYVMWMHWENGQNYGEARAAVAYSSTVDGNYTYQGSFRPLGQHMSRDITLYKDDDGTAYMISAARENYDLHIYRLNADYRGVAQLVGNPWPGGHREAPALFKRNGVYFMLTSGATGWSPNQAKYATATSVSGPWSAMRNVGDSTTYRSQPAYVLPIQGTQTTSYLYLGDRWAGAWNAPVGDSSYVWLPITFSDNTTMNLSNAGQIVIDTAAGTITTVALTYNRISVRHSGKCLDIANASGADGAALMQYPCGSGQNQQFRLQSAGGSYYQVIARHSGKCLDVSDAATADGAAVVQWSCNTGQNQQWSLVDAGSGYSRLVARHSGKCLDLPSSSQDNLQFKQYPCGSGQNQQFQLTRV
ncbi:RICIN domain-containing protein [Saccharothrix texasensis]|uniref:Ricin-type beta-trefoil lectin protein n=1 Tax=Saccharothrix texasensis TaxID=103734 RepID=A0A3N1HJ39_9PSEU|nr:RICIN domain-containing protein [Saccharothrix texasensis]ROP42509.1 ricin-type beta-trefoil lectin protein [Saccharothrix texasensis]